MGEVFRPSLLLYVYPKQIVFLRDMKTALKVPQNNPTFPIPLVHGLFLLFLSLYSFLKPQFLDFFALQQKIKNKNKNKNQGDHEIIMACIYHMYCIYLCIVLSTLAIMILNYMSSSLSNAVREGGFPIHIHTFVHHTFIHQPREPKFVDKKKSFG